MTFTALSKHYFFIDIERKKQLCKRAWKLKLQKALQSEMLWDLSHFFHYQLFQFHFCLDLLPQANLLMPKSKAY